MMKIKKWNDLTGKQKKAVVAVGAGACIATAGVVLLISAMKHPKTLYDLGAEGDIVDFVGDHVAAIGFKTGGSWVATVEGDDVSEVVDWLRVIADMFENP